MLRACAERNIAMRQAKTEVTGSRARAPAGDAPRAGSARTDATFDSTLKHLIGLADALLSQRTKDEPSAAKPSKAADASVTGAAGAPSAEAATLERALGELDAEAALKLRTLVIAGRDGRDISSVHAAAPATETEPSFSGRDLKEHGALLADYLRRGQAIACATGFDLEKPVTGWPSATAHSLDERAWLSFGKQLAMSQPDDWKCLGVVDGRGSQQLTKLYLRLADNAWWSFRSVLDRPSPAIVDREKRALKRRRSNSVADGSLKNMADRPCATEGRALR